MPRNDPIGMSSKQAQSARRSQNHPKPSQLGWRYMVSSKDKDAAKAIVKRGMEVLFLYKPGREGRTIYNDHRGMAKNKRSKQYSMLGSVTVWPKDKPVPDGYIPYPEDVINKMMGEDSTERFFTMQAQRFLEEHGGSPLDKHMRSKRGKGRSRMPKEKTLSQAQLDRMMR